MDFNRIAARIANSDEVTASYLDEPVPIKNVKKLEGWAKTRDGQDLLSLVQQVKTQSKQPTKELPHVLQKLISSATEVLMYVKS